MDRISRPAKPAWQGPLQGGITQSIINKFLECPFRFYLYAVLGLEESNSLHPNLVWGDIFHKGLELILEHPVPVAEMSDAEYQPVCDEIIEYINTKHPSAPASYPHTITLMLRLYDDRFKLEGNWETEREFKRPYTTRHGHQITFRGKVDAIDIVDSLDQPDIPGGVRLAEHKCKGKYDMQLSRMETPKDLQVNLYAFVTGAREIIYDQIAIPEAQFYLPQRRAAERWSVWSNRIIHTEGSGKFPVARNRHLWFDQFTTFLDDESIDFQMQYTIEPLVDRMCTWWERVNEPSFDPNNPDCYDGVFYITPIRHFDPSNTDKFKCNYHSFLCGNIELADLTPTKFYAELSE